MACSRDEPALWGEHRRPRGCSIEDGEQHQRLIRLEQPPGLPG
jgi:hypothetical protein